MSWNTIFRTNFLVWLDIKELEVWGLTVNELLTRSVEISISVPDMYRVPSTYRRGNDLPSTKKFLKLENVAKSTDGWQNFSSVDFFLLVNQHFWLAKLFSLPHPPQKTRLHLPSRDFNAEDLFGICLKSPTFLNLEKDRINFHTSAPLNGDSKKD